MATKNLQPKPDKDMGTEVEKLGGYRPGTSRLMPKGAEMRPRRVAYMEIMTMYELRPGTVAAPTRRRSLYSRGI